MPPIPIHARLVRVLAASLMLMCVPGCPNMAEVMRLYGFTEIKPPSKFFAPGTMVWVRSQYPFSAGIICTEQSSLGKAFRPVVSETAAMELKRATDRSFSLDADYLQVLRADARFSAVHEVTMRLERPVMYEVVDTDILKHQQDRSANCRKAVAMRRDAGYQVTMIASALQADVTYTVTWSHDVGAAVGSSMETLQALAVELGADHAQVHERSITAKGLFWGIRDDAFLAQLSEPHVLFNLPANTRIISPARTLAIASTPDVTD